MAAVGYFGRQPAQPRNLLAAFSQATSFARSGACEVLVVIDGDTLLVKQAASERAPEFIGIVRLLGINTPETVKRGVAPQPYGAEATAFTKSAVAASAVSLQLDKRRVDRYGRFLAYVYTGQSLLNEDLVTAGLARVHTYPGDSMTINRQLLRAQDEAKRERRGMWQEPETVPMTADED
ncbi:thermonuclease family protein [Anatilimnocola aggregata]|uniref:thermonuclease family protein n=1 Tax=Anatilimnocola aggregata TaxID=2528021 RepID=UPI00192E5BF9|nr:thermonuclease family protein [Anatilimnocola aggregata]